MSLKYDSVKILRKVTSGFMNRLQGVWGIVVGRPSKGGPFLLVSFSLVLAFPFSLPALSGCLYLYLVM